jgi:DNA-binding NtrC family response regulator
VDAGGTVILTDVTDLEAAGQAALSAWVETPREGPRAIATAAPSIREAVAGGTFSRDLYYRLSPTVVDLPPLRARTDDIGLLAHVFLERATSRFGLPPKRFSREALRALKAWAFPDNAPELEAVVVRAATSSSDATIRPGDLGLPAPRESVRPRAVADGDVLVYTVERERAMRAFEKAYAERVLAHAGGNVSQAARLAGMDPANMRRLLRRVRSGRPTG